MLWATAGGAAAAAVPAGAALPCRQPLQTTSCRCLPLPPAPCLPAAHEEDAGCADQPDAALRWRWLTRARLIDRPTAHMHAQLPRRQTRQPWAQPTRLHQAAWRRPPCSCLSLPVDPACTCSLCTPFCPAAPCSALLAAPRFLQPLPLSPSPVWPWLHSCMPHSPRPSHQLPLLSILLIALHEPRECLP